MVTDIKTSVSWVVLLVTGIVFLYAQLSSNQAAEVDLEFRTVKYKRGTAITRTAKIISITFLVSFLNIFFILISSRFWPQKRGKTLLAEKSF